MGARLQKAHKQILRCRACIHSVPYLDYGKSVEYQTQCDRHVNQLQLGVRNARSADARSYSGMIHYPNASYRGSPKALKTAEYRRC
jgi:hypothetical protein